MTIKVIIIDHSLRKCAALTEIIDGAADLEVIGTAQDAAAGLQMILASAPDVLILDLDLSRSAGIDALDRLIRQRCLPAIRVVEGFETEFAPAFNPPDNRAGRGPAMPRSGNLSPQGHAEAIRVRIRAASNARKESASAGAASPAPSFQASKAGFSQRLLAERVIAIGASTGGTEAIREVICSLPAQMPPIVIVQHMPEAFTPSFARRLDSLSNVTVCEAQGDERLQPGTAYLAPGHSHMRIRKSGAGYVLELSRDEPVNRHRPSVDVLFWSVAEHVRQNALGVILTGMGKDGAQGLLAMRQAGAWNVGQNQASSAVYGMPREAAEVGALDEVASLRDIPAALLGRLRQLDGRAAPV